jgi:hypothetical protein
MCTHSLTDTEKKLTGGKSPQTLIIPRYIHGKNIYYLYTVMVQYGEAIISIHTITLLWSL